MTNNARQIKALENKDLAPSGNVLREAGRPLRERAGRESPPLHTRFRKGQSGNPGGRSKKNLPALLADAIDEPVFVTIDGERHKITKREAVVHQLVNKSTTADLRATKMLFDMMKDAEQKAGVAAPAAEPRPFDKADEEVVEQLVERIRDQIQAEITAQKAEGQARRKRDQRAPAVTPSVGLIGESPNDG